MIFCRYCGAAIAEDSLFCAKCGRKLGRVTNPKLEAFLTKYKLRTPYPYFGVLVLLILTFGIAAREKQAPVDYSGLKWTLQPERKLDFPDEKLYQEAFSLILENGSSSTVQNLPIDFSARIEPPQPAEIEANFLGSKVLLVHKGKSLPLTILLSDAVLPGKKRNFSVDGSITAAETPFKVTYEIRERDSQKLLASYEIER